MFWCQLFLVALLASSPQGGCSCDRVSSHPYALGPADVDLGEVHVFGAASGLLLLLQRAPGTGNMQVYESSDGVVWRSAKREQQLAMRHLVASSGATQSKVIYRLLESDSALERSVNSGRSWVRAQMRFHGRDGEDKLEHKVTTITIVGTNGLTLYARIGARESKYSQETPWPGVYASHDGGDE
jgi:hypothetical protein